MKYSYVGFKSIIIEENLQKDTVINISLTNNMILKDVVILSERKETDFHSTLTGAVEIPVKQITSGPALLGETDVIKTIQMMPGVNSGIEGLSGMYVRGGGAEQNLYRLDGVSIYNIDHMLGINSIFCPEAIKRVDLYKGSFPARFGGRISSVLDVHTNDGDMYKYHGAFTVGLLSSRLNFEGPIIKGKTSFLLSARRSYYDLLMRPFMPDDEKVGVKFYDMNLKLNHKFSDKSRLFLSSYNGSDILHSEYKYDWSSDYYYGNNLEEEDIKLKWGNFVTSLRWNYIFSNKLFSNVRASYNQYKMIYADDCWSKNKYEERITNHQYKSGIYDWNLSMDLDYYANKNNHIKFGGYYIYHTFQPEVVSFKEVNKESSGAVIDKFENNNRNSNKSDINAHEAALYIEDDIKIGSHFEVNAGAHLSLFTVREKKYLSLQPRVSAKYAFTDIISVKASYSRMKQYINLLTTSSISMPTDLWVPVTDKFKPMSSDIYSTGLYFDFRNGWQISVEGYYKNMNNLLEYKDGQSFMGSSNNWENLVASGKGRSYGAEFLLQKTTGKLTGWIGYTLAKSDRIFNKEVNLGKRFPFKYDRRHAVDVVMNYKFNKKVDISANWKYYTGGTATIAYQNSEILLPNGATASIDYTESRNNYRLPATHLLNLGINLHKQKKYGMRTWSLGLYNAYNNMNPSLVMIKRKNESYSYTYYRYDENGNWILETTDYKQDDKPVINKITILPLIPTISYTYRF